MPETVSILNERRILLPSAPGASQEMIAVTYALRGLAPRIVYIDPARDSDEERKRVIADDIQKARAAKTSTLQLD